MAFGKEMGMMGGSSKLKPSPKGKPEGKPKDEEKHESKPEHEGHDGKKHFHVSHDGLSYQAHGEHEDGQKEEPMDHPDMASVHNHMNSFFGEGGDDQQEAMPEQHHHMMGGFGG